MGSFVARVRPSAPDPLNTRPLRAIPFGSFRLRRRPCRAPVRSTTATTTTMMMMMNCLLVPLVSVFPFDFDDDCRPCVPCPINQPTNQPTARIEFPCPIGGGRRRRTSSLPKWRHSPESMFVCHCYTQKQNPINTTTKTEPFFFIFFYLFLFINFNVEKVS
jgi:hypothetical protein